MNSKQTILFLAIIFSLSSCGQTDPNQQVDEGKVENSTYSSKEIGWTITIPKGWDVRSKELQEKLQKKGLDAMGETVGGEIDASGLKNLIGFEKDQFNIFQSTSEPFMLEYEGEWEENNVKIKEVICNTYQNQGIRFDSTATEIVNIDGLDFHKYKFTIFTPDGEEILLNQLFYSRLINGLDFGVNINYNNESDRKDMQDAWLNSKFAKED